MKAKDVFARGLGGLAGVTVAAAVPHLGCLGTLTATFVGVGMGAETAVTAGQVTGAGMVVAGLGAAAYGLRPSREVCCVFWGETPRVRIRKAAAMAVVGFGLMGVFNTLADRGISGDLGTARILEFAHAQGRSVWTALDDICRAPGVR